MTDTSAQLKSADQAAMQQSATMGPGDTVLPCGLVQDHRIVEGKVVGEDGQPIAGVVVALRRADGRELRADTDRAGQVRFVGVEKGSYDLSLPALDQDAWKVARDETLETPATAEQAEWQPAPAAEPGKQVDHTVEQGDCVSSLAERFGLFPDTIWSLPANADLQKRRKAKNILSPGDKLVIPSRTVKWVPAVAGKRYHLQRLGVPETLRVRFLDDSSNPRASAPYLVKITAGDQVLPARKGTTDGDGLLVEAIPPGATLADVVVGKGDAQEPHAFQLGCVDPIDTLSGARARLTNLGYPCDGEEGSEVGPITEAALLAFQQDHGLDATGVYDDATRGLLEQRHLS
jgi:hypothetical protein